MQTQSRDGLASTTVPQLDRAINRLVGERAVLNKKFLTMYRIAAVLVALGLFLLVLTVAFFDKSAALAAISLVFLILSGIFSAIGAGFQTPFILKNRPLQRLYAVRSGLVNAGFVYDNHKEAFGKFWVFFEQTGDRVAIVTLSSPSSPFIAEYAAYVTLTLDGARAFVGRVRESAPALRDFIVHPDFRYREKNKPVYEKAELRVINDKDDVFMYAFPFRNALRKQFIFMTSYMCQPTNKGE